MTSPRRDHWTGNFNVCGTPLAGDGPVFKFSSRPSLETGRLGRPPTCSFCACSVRHFLCLFRVKGPPPCRRWSRTHGVAGPIRTRRPRAAHGFQSTLQGPGASGRAPPWPALTGSGRPESPGRALRPRPGIRRAAAAAAGSNADSDIKLLP